MGRFSAHAVSATRSGDLGGGSVCVTSTAWATSCPSYRLYDGSHCIAEYACPEPAEWDANDVLLRKTIYGPGVDQPICMIDVADANLALSLSNGAAYYYYHYDALGSVVALSDSAGDTVQVYEYDVYGQVAASDPNHPNPFLFTGRRYDTETGLYYYRARYYNPSIGRFLQTDPIGYGDGMNMYRYCGNNPVGMTDPLGTDSEDSGYTEEDLGYWYRPTGHLLILPWSMDPGDIAACLGFSSYMKWAAKIIKKIGKGTPPGKLISKYFQWGGDLAAALPKIPSQMKWKVYIEIEEYNIVESGEEIVRLDHGKKWVEVKHLVGWTDESYYVSWSDAVRAAMRGITFYYKQKNWKNLGYDEEPRPDPSWFHDDVPMPIFEDTRGYGGDTPELWWYLIDGKVGASRF